MISNVFMLYANCLPVKGHSRTAICDLQRGNIQLVPNSLTDLFIDERYLVVDRILAELEDEDAETFTSYLQLLEGRELGFFCTEEDIPTFPKLPTEWLFPGHITNGILDAEDNLWYFDSDFLEQLDTLGCDYLQIRFYKQTLFQHLNDILNLVKVSKIKAVELLIPKSDEKNFYDAAKELVTSFPQIQTLILHSDSMSKVIRPAHLGMGQIVTSTSKITNQSHCGLVSPSYFAINIPHFTESLAFNTCLHRKISVDANGKIRNCPSMIETFGNIVNTKLCDAIEMPGYKTYWGIGKDQIMVCRDCEFRHVCTDCRAYLEEPFNPYGKPLKCGYDPYTNVWQDWSQSPFKQQAIRHYGM